MIKRKRKRLSISGPMVVNDMLEVKRDSQLLETETQPRGPSKDTLSKTDKNIYDELKGKLMDCSKCLYCMQYAIANGAMQHSSIKLSLAMPI